MANSYLASRTSQRLQGQGLRDTKDRETRAIALQDTLVRKCSFFHHLDRDIRNIIYGRLNLPPSPKAKQCAGLFFSCQRAKSEIEEEATREFKIFLNAWKRWNAEAQPRIGPILTSSLESYRNIQHITITGLPARRADLLPVLASMRLNVLHVIIRVPSIGIILTHSIHDDLRNLIKHMAINYGRPGFFAYGVRTLVVSVVPEDVPRRMQEILDGLGAELKPSSNLTRREWRWPSYYQFESQDHLMLTHVLRSYDLRELIMPPPWWWFGVYISTLVSNPNFLRQRVWRATLKHETLELFDGEEIIERGNEVQQSLTLLEAPPG